MFSIKEFFMRTFLKKIAGSMIRHGMTVLGGFLLSQGLSDKVVTDFITSGEQVFMALSTVVIGLAMSFLEKKSKL